MTLDLVYVGFWGFIGSSSLIIGALIGYYLNIPQKISSSLIAFSAGILTSAVCFEILFESNLYGGLIPTITGFMIGMGIFTTMDIIVSHLNTKSIKDDFTILDDFDNKSKDESTFSNDSKNKSKDEQATYKDSSNYKNDYSALKGKISKIINYKIKPDNKYEKSSLISVFSVLIEGIPDALAIGLILIIGGPISIALVISIFLANLFEGLSGAESMRLGKWKKNSIFRIWIFVVLLAPICAMLGYIIFSNTDHHILSLALGISAGAIISMIADTMLPQAFNETQEYTGTLMALGFITSFVLSHTI